MANKQGLQQILEPSTSDQLLADQGGNQGQQKIRRKTIYTRTDLGGRSKHETENHIVSPQTSLSPRKNNAKPTTIPPQMRKEFKLKVEPFEIKKTQSLPNTVYADSLNQSSEIPKMDVYQAREIP